MNTLSPAEWRVAEEYCKGLADKEVADKLCRSIWTTKSQKKTIYKKLGISNSTELLLYMISLVSTKNVDD
ncbi:helix-turn-helix transcriptional regulator [Bacteroides sp.]|uniref:helix-turn-helix transcriptional regulator n=1 Tax=Bacteroides sp. TaxID=29523 RepID=UPI003D12ED88